MIGSLEQRVAERTRGLEAAAQVSRATTSVLDPEELLRQVAELVRERFDLYYVGLFLTQQETDDVGATPRGRPREWAVLRAGTGEAGQQMLADGHRLEAGGESMIGWCITHGQARIALDVGHEAVRFDNPLLPETRSEMALPLRSRGRVIGAMTVQSKAEAAFDEADVAVMQTMADQVAVAIDNAHLFAETEAALKELETVHRSYMRETWSEYLHVAETTGYDTAGLGTVSRQEIEQAMAGRGPAAVDQEEAGLHSALVAPIMLRDEVIGVLGIHDQAGTGPPRKWTEDEMRMVEGVANRLALAAENLRLLDETRRRAARERLAREITDQIRAAVSVEDAVQRAMQGMSRALGASEMVARIGTEQDLTAGPQATSGTGQTPERHRGQGGDGHE
jgi:GAF domain-containing protein